MAEVLLPILDKIGKPLLALPGKKEFYETITFTDIERELYKNLELGIC